MIQVVNVGYGPALYDRNTMRHDHLVCSQCGKVIDYTFPGLEEALELVRRTTDFQARKAELLFIGLCSECQS